MASALAGTVYHLGLVRSVSLPRDTGTDRQPGPGRKENGRFAWGQLVRPSVMLASHPVVAIHDRTLRGTEYQQRRSDGRPRRPPNPMLAAERWSLERRIVWHAKRLRANRHMHDTALLVGLAARRHVSLHGDRYRCLPRRRL